MKKEHYCENKPGDKLYKIGMFAAMNHVTIKALRYYDEQGLLKPVYVDADSGYRYYTAGQLPEVIIASVKTTLHGYEDLFDVMPPMGQEMERLGCISAEPEYCFTIYHDGGYREEDIKVEICQAVTEKRQDSETVKFKVMPAVETAACILHKGSYEGFPEAYAQVLRFVENNGYEICGNPRESYIDGVWNKESEEEWLSEIQFPVKRTSVERL